MKKLIKYLFLFCLLLLYSQVKADSSLVVKTIQYDSADLQRLYFDDHALQDYRSDSEFNYIRENEESIGLFERLLIWLLSKIFGNGNYATTFDVLYNLFIYVILPVTILFIIWKLIGADRRALFYGRKSRSVRVQEEIDNIREADLHSVVDEAIKNEDYKKAVRYSYLILLKELTEKGIIEWSSAKTNYDYLKEIKFKDVKSSFLEATRIFEYCWYGDIPLTKENFAKARASFQMISTGVKNK